MISDSRPSVIAEDILWYQLLQPQVGNLEDSATGRRNSNMHPRTEMSITQAMQNTMRK